MEVNTRLKNNSNTLSFSQSLLWLCLGTIHRKTTDVFEILQEQKKTKNSVNKADHILDSYLASVLFKIIIVIIYPKIGKIDTDLSFK